MQRSDIDRCIRKPSVKYKSNSARTSNSFLHRSAYIYNFIPDDLRLLNKKLFYKQIQQYIKNNFDTKHIPRLTDTN